MFCIRPIEGFLIQFIGYILLWLASDYVASLITIVFTTIIIAVLVISYIVEWIEPSKISRAYFTWMLVSILAPVAAGLVFVYLMGGQLEWLTE